MLILYKMSGECRQKKMYKKIYYDKDLYTRLYNSSLSSIMKIFTLPKQDFLIYLLYSIFYFEIK